MYALSLSTKTRGFVYIHQCKQCGMVFNPKNEDGFPFELNDIILYPKERHSYSNEPYAFESRDEIIKYIGLAKRITNFDQIFKLVKNIFKKYVDAEDHLQI